MLNFNYSGTSSFWSVLTTVEASSVGSDLTIVERLLFVQF